MTLDVCVVDLWVRIVNCLILPVPGVIVHLSVDWSSLILCSRLLLLLVLRMLRVWMVLLVLIVS